MHRAQWCLKVQNELLYNYHYVYFRGLGKLAAIFQRVETALGLPNQADPADDGIKTKRNRVLS